MNTRASLADSSDKVSVRAAKVFDLGQTAAPLYFGFGNATYWAVGRVTEI
jgi:hypothetical protein